jgi:hypothetical protein
VAANPPRVWEEKQGVVRIQTGPPDKNSPLGYCEIGHWKLNVRGELILRNEDGALLRNAGSKAIRTRPPWRQSCCGRGGWRIGNLISAVCSDTSRMIGWPDKQNRPAMNRAADSNERERSGAFLRPVATSSPAVSIPRQSRGL